MNLRAKTSPIIGFKPYSRVFAKVPGYPYWPGAVIPLDKYPDSFKSATDKQLGILFYGSMDFALVKIDQLKEFDDHLVEAMLTKRKDLIKAITHAQTVTPAELMENMATEMQIDLPAPKTLAESIKSEHLSESPRKSSSTRKSKRKKVYHKDFEKIVKVKRYLSHRIYGKHSLKLNVDKIDKALSWLSAIQDINFRLIEDTRIGHVLGYIASKPPKTTLGTQLIKIDIPNKCKIIIDNWTEKIKAENI
eukprot:NODE_43_length_33755_cov_1.178542.p20 type:complete len:248 gc:universal NODE_43_length_33755_cov_1.178542:4611-3868(-)